MSLTKTPTLKVEKLKEIAPLIDAYEFKKQNFYLFIVKPARVIGGSGINPETIPKLKAMLISAKIKHAFVMDDGEGLKIFSLEPGV